MPAEIQLTLMDEPMRLGRRANSLVPAQPAQRTGCRGADTAHLAEIQLGLKLDELLEGRPASAGWCATRASSSAMPELLARMVAGTSHLYTLLPIIEAADVTGHEPAQVAKAFFAVGSALDLTWYLQEISNLPVENNWQAGFARRVPRSTSTQQRAITISAGDGRRAAGHGRARGVVGRAASVMVERWRAMLDDLRNATGTDYAMHAVANRELVDLAMSGQAAVVPSWIFS